MTGLVPRAPSKSRKRCRSLPLPAATRSPARRTESPSFSRKAWPATLPPGAMATTPSTGSFPPMCSAKRPPWLWPAMKISGRRRPDDDRSVRLRQPEHLLRDVAQDELRTDGGDARDHHLAQVALDVVLLRVAVTTVGHHGRGACLEPGFSRKVLRGVRLSAARLARVVEGGGLHDHEVRSLELHPAFGERMLDRLVLADGTVEDDAILRVLRRAPQRHLAKTDSFGRNEDALRVHAMQDVLEAATLFADAVLDRDFQAVEE